MKEFLLRPYPGKELDDKRRIFNYRLSRARRIVENAFGILCARWRIYFTMIGCNPENVDNIIKATIALHNFCLNHNPETYFQAETCSRLDDVTKAGSNFYSNDAAGVRDKFKEYFFSIVGQVVWQEKLLTTGQI